MFHRTRALLLSTLVAGIFTFGGWARGEAADAYAEAEPPLDGPVPVSVGLYVLDLPRLDQIENSYLITADIQVSWTDPRRAMPGADQPRAYLGEEGTRAMEGGWWPQLGVKTLVGSSSPQQDEFTVFPDGRVVFRRRVFGDIRTPLEFRSFPFDSQLLQLPIESFTWGEDVIILVPDMSATGLDDDLSMPEWQVGGIQAEIGSSRNPHRSVSFSRILFTIDLERRVGFYLWKILLPVITIVVLSWIVFWMTSESLSRRAGVSSTTILTVIAYQFIIASSLPRLPYLTVLDRVVLFSFITIALTMPVNLIATRPAAQETGHGLKVDRLCRVVFPLWYAVGVVLILFGPWSGRS